MNEMARGAVPTKSAQRRFKLHRFSAVQLLISLALLLICAPLVEEMEGGKLIETSLLSLVVLSAVVAIADRKSVLAIALVLAVPAVAARWINYFRPNLVHPAVFLVCGLLVLALVIARLLRFVLRAPSVDTEVLCASIAAYLLLGLMWTMSSKQESITISPLDACRPLGGTTVIPP